MSKVRSSLTALTVRMLLVLCLVSLGWREAFGSENEGNEAEPGCVNCADGNSESVDGGLSLEEVLERTLRSSFTIRRFVSRVTLGEGRLGVAKSIFDPVPTVSGSVNREDLPTLANVQVRSAVTLRGTKKLRSGITLTPSISIEQTDIDLPGDSATSGGAASVSVSFPLLQDRGGVSSRADELAAGHNLDADKLNLRHQREIGLLTAAQLYWSYVAREQQLKVFQDSEGRAERLLTEMRELVAAEQRPASDIDQLTGNLASKRLDRIAAEQQVVSTRQRLGLAMGLSTVEIYGLPLPSDSFPGTEPFELTDRTLARLTAVAMRERADLQASSRSTEAAEERVRGAQNDLLSTLDLTLSASYDGLETGSSGPGTFFGGLYENLEGPSASLLFRWQRPLRNEAARSVLLQEQALGTELELLRKELEITIATEVQVACSDLARQVLRVAGASESVHYRRETVNNEKAKNRLGLATLFDVILAEDNLTAALLSEVAARQSYANALASLRFQTGTLELDDLRGMPPEAPDVSLLLTPP